MEMMTLREQFERRKLQWRSFNEWEDAQPPVTRDPSAILADVGTLLSWLPPEVRWQDPDPEKKGIGKMRAALGLLRQR
jgi:hypothetical protein